MKKIDQIEALKYIVSTVLLLAFFLAFFGGYWSAAKQRWWMGFFVVFIYIITHHFIQPFRHGGKDFYERILRHLISFLMAAFFLLLFMIGYWAAPARRWWLSFPLIFFYFLTVRFIQKARK